MPVKKVNGNSGDGRLQNKLSILIHKSGAITSRLSMAGWRLEKVLDRTLNHSEISPQNAFTEAVTIQLSD